MEREEGVSETFKLTAAQLLQKKVGGSWGSLLVTCF
jgi:hypothetical protein